MTPQGGFWSESHKWGFNIIHATFTFLTYLFQNPDHFPFALLSGLLVFLLKCLFRANFWANRLISFMQLNLSKYGAGVKVSPLVKSETSTSVRLNEDRLITQLTLHLYIGVVTPTLSIGVCMMFPKWDCGVARFSLTFFISIFGTIKHVPPPPPRLEADCENWPPV